MEKDVHRTSTGISLETSFRNRLRKFAVSVVSLLFFTLALRADTAIQIAADLPPAKQELHGRLTLHEGLPVLELWGTPEEAAYAHGFLLAEPIIRLFDEFVLAPKTLPDPALYENVLVPGVRRQFVWTPEQVRELEALLHGLEDRLPEDRRNSRVLGRPLQIEDLMIGNTLADWFGAFCSSFSVWGALTPDGKILTARNLDFPSTPAMQRMQLVIVRRGAADQPGWIGIGWPGTVGVYTALNENGVTMLMHDAGGLPPSSGAGFTPRALILREALLAAKSETWLDDVRKVFQERLVLVGNNIHVSGPRGAGLPAAAIFEYDANSRDRGVTIRIADANAPALSDALWCTNHMRLRKEPTECGRYRVIEEGLRQALRDGKRLGPDDAFELLRAARQSITLHSVCLLPESRIMLVSIPTESAAVVEFRLADWLKSSKDDSVSDK